MKIFKYLHFLLHLGKLSIKHLKETYLHYSIQRKLIHANTFQLGKEVVINNYQDFTPPQEGKIGDYSRVLLVGFLNDSNRNQSIYLGKKVIISRHVELTVWENNHLTIKDNSSVQDYCKLLGSVTIERNCLLAPNVFMSSGNHYIHHHPSDLIKNQDKEVLSTPEGIQAHVKAIHIEEDCWLGLGVFVKRGTYIGKGAVIGAYTSVTSNVPPYSIQAGSPNKTIKTRLDFAPPSAIQATNETHWPYFYRGFAHSVDIRKESLAQGGLFAYDQALITLEQKTFEKLSFDVFFSENPASNEVVIKMNGVILEECLLDPAKSTYTIVVAKDIYEKAQQNINKYPDVLQKYHLFEFESTHKTNQQQPVYGIKSCEIH